MIFIPDDVFDSADALAEELGISRSRLRTVVAVSLSSNLPLLDAPGNALLHRKETGLPRDSVGVVSQVVTLDRAYLVERVGKIPLHPMTQVKAGLRLAMDL
ncbi:type II toxin-antitoxin system PemK/MazF family toxin [Gemmatimonadota bacterium]